MKLSVSIITYNQEDTIAQAVESALAQVTEFPIEIIVADDGSTDRTPDVLRELSERVADDRLRLLLHEENFGDLAMSNIRSTIEAARGEYIAFLDGDDYWTSSDKLARQVEFLERYPDCVFCAHRVAHIGASFRSLSHCPGRGETIHERRKLLVNNFTPRVSIVARSFAVRDMPDWYWTCNVMSADWLMNVLLTRHGKIGFIDDLMAVHRVHESSLSTTYGVERMVEDKMRIMKLLREEFPGETLYFDFAERMLALRLRVIKASPTLFAAIRQLVRRLRRSPRPPELQGNSK